MLTTKWVAQSKWVTHFYYRIEYYFRWCCLPLSSYSVFYSCRSMMYFQVWYVYARFVGTGSTRHDGSFNVFASIVQFLPLIFSFVFLLIRSIITFCAQKVIKKARHADAPLPLAKLGCARCKNSSKLGFHSLAQVFTHSSCS